MSATMVRVVVQAIELANQLELAKQQLWASKRELEDTKRKMGEVELDQQLKDAQEKGCLMEDHLLIIFDKLVAVWTEVQRAKEGWEEERCQALGLEKEAIAAYKDSDGFR